MATSAERYVIAKPSGWLVADIYGNPAEYRSREEADALSALDRLGAPESLASRGHPFASVSPRETFEAHSLGQGDRLV